MSGKYVLYAWQMSYYSGKARSYLRYKGVPFAERAMNLRTLWGTIKRRTGEVVMPVLVTPEDEWIQDTAVIIDKMEERFPSKPVQPSKPVMRIASALLEVWGDEWWVPMAMYARWNFPENYVLFEREAGKNLLPYFPWVLQKRSAAQAAGAMRRHLPGLGVVPSQNDLLESWTGEMLDRLDAHFAAIPFLLGESPTRGDFGLVGPLYAHFARDPRSGRVYIAPRKHLSGWLDRIVKVQRTGFAGFPEDDRTPASLDPVFQSIATEMVPMIEGTLAEMLKAKETLPAGKPFSRGLGTIGFPLGEGHFQRAGSPFVLWKIQRVLDLFRALSPEEREAVRAWFGRFGGSRLFDLEIPRLRRSGLRVLLDTGEGRPVSHTVVA